MATWTPRSLNLATVTAAVNRGASAMAMRPMTLPDAPHVNHGASRPLQSLGLRSELADIEFLSVDQPAIPQQYRFAVDLGPRTHALDVLEALLHRNGKPLCTPHNGLRQRVVRTLLHRRSGGEHGVGPHAFRCHHVNDLGLTDGERAGLVEDD